MRRPNGFSLLTMLAVVAIIGTLIGLLLPSVKSARERSRSLKSYEGDLANSATVEAKGGASSASPYSQSQSSHSRFSDAGASIALAQNLELAEVSRKIIYEADLSVTVESVGDAEKELLKLVKELKGYVAEANVNRVQGEQLSGRWKIRIPVDQFDVFLDSVSQLGVTETRNQGTQDVTEEFVDLEARIANQKQLEERILGLLEKSTGAITDVIAVERELGRIRGDIEQMEGRLKYLSNRTDLTTVTIAFREEQEYEPEVAPTIGDRIGESWNSSLESLKGFGERFLLATVAASPWIAVMSVILVPSYWIASNRVKRKQSAISKPQELSKS